MDGAEMPPFMGVQARGAGGTIHSQLKAASQMTLASRDSNITGWGSFGIIHELYTGWPTGCLLISDSLTVGEFGLSGLTGSSRWRMPPFSSLDKRSRAALDFPTKISLEKEQARLELALVEPFLGSLC